MIWPFPEQRRGKRPMTYIVGLRSPDGGFVMSADSQETIEEEINYVEKITTDNAGLWEVAIGGAGRAELVEGFVQHAIGAIGQSDAADGAHLDQVIRNAIVVLPTKTGHLS